MQMPNTFWAGRGAGTGLHRNARARSGAHLKVRNPTLGESVELQRRGFGGEVPSNGRNVQYWLDRAEEARLQAEEMTYADSRREMLKVAAAYRLLARLADRDPAASQQRVRHSPR
jgi:hypothetical protein